jgi:hypothetical protein
MKAMLSTYSLDKDADDRFHRRAVENKRALAEY